MVSKLHANACLVKGYRIDVDDGRAHAICLDLEPNLGTDLGPSALELALMSLAGCYATIFKRTTDKMRLAIDSLEVKAEGTKSESAGTITETRLDIMVRTKAPKDRVEKAHELTLKSCPVGKIFDHAGVKSNYNLHIEKA